MGTMSLELLQLQSPRHCLEIHRLKIPSAAYTHARSCAPKPRSSDWARRHARYRPSPDPQRYRHLISSIKIVENAAAGPLELVANFLVVRTMQDGAMTLFAAGRYIDRVVRSETGWKFARKTVILDSRRIDTLLAIPL